MTVELKDPGKIEYSTNIKMGKSFFLDFPYNPKKLYGKSDYIPIRVLLDNLIEYKGKMADIFSSPKIKIGKNITGKLGKKKGDQVRVSLILDKDKNEIHWPIDVENAFVRDGIMEYANKLSLSHKLEYSRYIEGAKKPKTRTKRIQKTIEMVKAKIV